MLVPTSSTQPREGLNQRGKALQNCSTSCSWRWIWSPNFLIQPQLFSPESLSCPPAPAARLPPITGPLLSLPSTEVCWTHPKLKAADPKNIRAPGMGQEVLGKMRSHLEEPPCAITGAMQMWGHAQNCQRRAPGFWFFN